MHKIFNYLYVSQKNHIYESHIYKVVYMKIVSDLVLEALLEAFKRFIYMEKFLYI